MLTVDVLGSVLWEGLISVAGLSYLPKPVLYAAMAAALALVYLLLRWSWKVIDRVFTELCQLLLIVGVGGLVAFALVTCDLAAWAQRITGAH